MKLLSAPSSVNPRVTGVLWRRCLMRSSLWTRWTARTVAACPCWDVLSSASPSPSSTAGLWPSTASVCSWMLTPWWVHTNMSLLWDEQRQFTTTLNKLETKSTNHCLAPELGHGSTSVNWVNMESSCIGCMNCRSVKTHVLSVWAAVASFLFGQCKRAVM